MYYRALLPFFFWGICITLSLTTCKPNANQENMSPVLQERSLHSQSNISQGASEGEACEEVLSREGFAKSSCQEGLVCVKNVLNNKAYCRVSCGERSRENDAEITKHPERCPKGRTCQLLQVSAGKLIHDLGAYCLVPQSERDGVCSVPDEEEACTEARVCAISGMGNREDPHAITAMVCRERCAYGNPDAVCQIAGEVCRADRFTQVHQLNAAETDAERCKPKECRESPENCPCDTQKGFSCSVQGVCLRPAGLCVQEVGGMTAAKLQEDIKMHLCNEITDHRFCDAAAYQGAKVTTRGHCMTMFPDGSGMCLDMCVPDELRKLVFGESSERRKQAYIALQLQKTTCGEGYQCTDAFARAFEQTGARPMMMPLKDKAGGVPKQCDLSICPDMSSCPNECGSGKAYCTEQDAGEGKKVGVCAIYQHTCEPIS